ncbi:hypothetical protein MHBO_001740 [Bonamia ostreae]|uniref:Protein TIC 214 n=1 Tax=Bonamia ostreae TaxID=126728 RepID=A0ABV2AK13_9EUKA
MNSFYRKGMLQAKNIKIPHLRNCLVFGAVIYMPIYAMTFYNLYPLLLPHQKKFLLSFTLLGSLDAEYKENGEEDEDE